MLFSLLKLVVEVVVLIGFGIVAKDVLFSLLKIVVEVVVLIGFGIVAKDVLFDFTVNSR